MHPNVMAQTFFIWVGHSLKLLKMHQEVHKIIDMLVLCKVIFCYNTKFPEALKATVWQDQDKKEKMF